MNLRIVIFGASGAIGGEFINHFIYNDEVESIYAFSRAPIKLQNSKVREYQINYEDEENLANTANAIKKEGEIDIIIIAIGMLHNEKVKPEKSLRDISLSNFQEIFLVNTIYPAIIVKHFMHLLRKDTKSTVAILSARVGSISDNYLGGWYAYRASKAALNMIIKNVSLEVKRTFNNAVIIGLHPGTVDSNLSKPYQGNIDKNKIFSVKYSVQNMLKVINNLTIQDSGRIFAWDGAEILP